MTAQKKLLLLGGSHYLLPVIEAAHAHGMYVVTMDYLPNNVAHRHSDEYVNVSVTNKEAVLEAARKIGADGIMSFACDPGVVPAAYVAEQMGIPFQGSYDAVCTLQDKGRFRRFLAEHGFNTPRSRRYDNPQEALENAGEFGWPVMVKPVDSAGSKGVSKVERPDAMRAAVENATKASFGDAIIVEEFLTFEGYHSSADPFTVDGRLAFVTYSDQLFDPEAQNPYTPSVIIWPTSMSQEHQDELSSETQRLMTLLEMRSGIYNIETCVGAGGIPYLMEVSPRGGGCKIAELQKLAFGVDLIDAEVRQATGMPVDDVRQTRCEGCWCELVVHAEPGRSGVLKSIELDPEVRERHVVVEDITARPGDMVEPFTGANMALGDLFLRFDTREELNDMVSRSREWIRINLA